MNSKARNIISADKKLISQSYTRTYPLVVRRAKGTEVWDVDGKKYMDFTSFVAVCNTGHSNPSVVSAVKKQAEKSLHAASTDFYNPLITELASLLSDITPGNFSKSVFFTNSGTESVECAFKLARWYTKKPRMISFFNSFHGRTFGSMSLSASKVVHRDHFSPLVPGVIHAPFPYCYRCPFGRERGECDMECLNYIEDELLEKVIPPDEVAAVISEPIQGEGGYIVPPDNFHKKLHKLCKQYGFLYISDEVQTGFCRTGKMFASEVFGVEPDIMSLAKAMAGGLPLGACISRRKIMSWPRGSHASTFGGNPIACAAAIANIKYMKSRNLCKNAEKLGNIGMKFLKELQQDLEIIGDVRGKGLMIGIELVKDRKNKKPAERESREVLNKAFRKGLLLISSGHSVIRVIPPLIIKREEFERGLEILSDVIKSVNKKKKP